MCIKYIHSTKIKKCYFLKYSGKRVMQILVNKSDWGSIVGYVQQLQFVWLTWYFFAGFLIAS